MRLGWMFVGVCLVAAGCGDDDGGSDEPTAGSGGSAGRGGSSPADAGAGGDAGSPEGGGSGGGGTDGGGSGRAGGEPGAGAGNEGGGSWAGGGGVGAGGASAGAGAGGADAGGAAGNARCGCPDGYQLQLNDVAEQELPSCEPAAECSANGATCTRPRAVAECGAQGCEIVACAPGWADCDGEGDNGCEADLTGPEACGSCSNECTLGQSCHDGECVDECQLPRTDCDGRCANLGNSEGDCGSCGNPCGGKTCSVGACALPCQDGYTQCGSNCVLGECPTAKCTECPPLEGPERACYRAGQDRQAICCGGEYEYTTHPTGAYCKYVGAHEACTANCDESPLAWVTGLGAPEALAIEDGQVVWSDPVLGEIARAAEAAGEKEVVADDLVTPRRLALAGSYVYWSDELGSAVMRASLDASGEPELVSAADEPLGIAVDSTHVYWVDIGTSSLRRAPLTGGEGEALWQGDVEPPGAEWADNVVVDDDYIYGVYAFRYTSGRTLKGVFSLSKADPQTVGPLSFSLDDDHTNQVELSVLDGQLSVSARNMANFGWDEFRADLIGASSAGAQLLSWSADVTGTAVSVARTAAYTYWSDGRSVLRAPNCGGASRVLATVADDIRDIALGDEYVYFTAGDWIGRVARGE